MAVRLPPHNLDWTTVQRSRRSHLKSFTATCLALLMTAALGQTPTRLKGALDGTFGPSDTLQVAFTCEGGTGGAGSCVGNYNAKFDEPKCVNSVYVLNAIALTGLDLSRPGPIQGVATLSNFYPEDKPGPDGTCLLSDEEYPVFTDTYSGTWNGTVATITFAPVVDRKGRVLQLGGTVRPDAGPAPVLPAAVSGRIDAAVVNAAATIQYRPEDVGRSGSVYAFAVAPATLVKAAAGGEPPFVVGKSRAADGAKDTPVACVLAQLNSSGQLQAVSAASLQAYVTGVLSAQGQAVTILNGAPTVNVGGATFYVGYGTSAAAMINNGINRNAVTVPGARECRPQPPQKGWWWNAAESGRGFSIEVSGNTLFMAAYLYDASGRSTWHVASGPTSIDGSVFNGQLLAFGGGVTLAGPYRANARLADAGPVTLTFDDATHGTLVWPGGTVALQRFDFGASGTATPALAGQPESGWWWGGAGDNGRGFFIEWQGNQAFLAGYLYDESGNATWYVSQGAVANAQSYQGTWLQFANGQTLTGAYRPATQVNGNVAPVAIQFQGADSAILTLPSGALPITRFRF